MDQPRKSVSKQKAILVALVLPDDSRVLTVEHLDELGRLTETAGGAVVCKVVQERNAPDAATWIGKGKAEEIGALVEAHEASLGPCSQEMGGRWQTREQIRCSSTMTREALIGSSSSWLPLTNLESKPGSG